MTRIRVAAACSAALMLPLGILAGGLPAQAATLGPCPTATTIPGGGGGSFPYSTTVAPSDTSTSIVVNVANDPQIQCGRTALTEQDNVVYSTPTLSDGTSLPLRMDIQRPSTPGCRPVVIFVPGGGFVSADKTQELDLRTYLAEAGFVVASIEYRTIVNGATYVNGVQDVKAAVRYLRANAATYGINPANVGLWGESAGGYLVGMVGTTNGVRSFDVGENLRQSSSVQAVVDKFGASDLSKIASDFDAASQAMYAAPNSFTAQYVLGVNSGKALSDDPAAVARANPITYISRDDPPFILFHGTDDRIVSPSQTLILHNALRAAGVKSTRYVLVGAGHGPLAAANGNIAGIDDWSTTAVMDTSVSFLAKQLKH
jgi:acetyl esterase/lipase